MKQKRTKSQAPRIAFAQVEEIMAGSGRRADALRGEGIAALAQVKRAELVQTRRERARVAVRHGEGSDRVAGLDRQMAMEHRFLVGSRAEHDRINTPILERDAKAWQVHGYLRDQDGYARSRYTVGLFADAEGGKSALATTTTDKRGYFHFKWTPKKGAATREEAAAAASEDAVAGKAKEREALRQERQRRSQLMVQALDQPVYLGARGSGGAAPAMDTRALHPVPGAIAYRDITVDDPRDGGERCHVATRLLGNSGTRELHTLDNEKAGCQIAAIRPDHRVYFANVAQAETLGYDFCAYCFGKARSKR